MHSTTTYKPYDLLAAAPPAVVWPLAVRRSRFGSVDGRGVRPCRYRRWSPAARPADGYRVARLRRGAHVCGGSLSPHEDKRSCLRETWWSLMRRVVRPANRGTPTADPAENRQERVHTDTLVASCSTCSLRPGYRLTALPVLTPHDTLGGVDTTTYHAHVKNSLSPTLRFG
jgi:hypothetical protein